MVHVIKTADGRRIFKVDVGNLTPQQVTAVLNDALRTKVSIWLKKKPKTITLHQLRDEMLDRFRTNVSVWFK